jgi:translocator protein
LLGFVGFSLLAAIASASVTSANQRRWYLILIQPPLTPPGQTLSAVWTVLYVLAAIAAWLVWRQPGPVSPQRGALTLWGWQMALSAAWSAAFFGLHTPLFAQMIAILLVLVTAQTIRQFSRLDKLAAIMLVPYLAWTACAVYLNAGFWWLNR